MLQVLDTNFNTFDLHFWHFWLWTCKFDFLCLDLTLPLLFSDKLFWPYMAPNNEDCAQSCAINEWIDLLKFGLTSKDIEYLQNGTWVLSRVGGSLQLLQGSDLVDIFQIIMWRSVFSISGKLVRCFPVCGWLCVANISCKGWDDKTNNVPLRWMIQKTSPDNCPKRVACRWKGNVSSLTTRVSLEINKSVIENVCRLHLPKDS